MIILQMKSFNGGDYFGIPEAGMLLGIYSSIEEAKEAVVSSYGNDLNVIRGDGIVTYDLGSDPESENSHVVLELNEYDVPFTHSYIR